MKKKPSKKSRSNPYHLPRSDKDLKQLAMDIVDGKVFTDLWHFRSRGEKERLLGMVFMPITFMEADQVKEMMRAKPGMVYEYLDEAMSGRCINGYPIFFSFRVLTGPDTIKVHALVRNFQKAKDDMVKNAEVIQTPNHATPRKTRRPVPGRKVARSQRKGKADAGRGGSKGKRKRPAGVDA